MVFAPTGYTDPHLTVGTEQIRGQLVLVANADIFLHPLLGRQGAQLVLRQDLPEAMNLLEAIPAQGNVTLLTIVPGADHVALVALLVLLFVVNRWEFPWRRRSPKGIYRGQAGHLMLALVNQSQHLVAVLKLVVNAALLVQNGTDIADTANGRLVRSVHHIEDAPFAHQVVTFQNKCAPRRSLLDWKREGGKA